ncbi:MAG: hypothetical protein ABFS37_14855 [Acidobacteriota bacterium]
MKRSLIILYVALAAGLAVYGAASALPPLDTTTICEILHIDQDQWSVMSGEEKVDAIKALPPEGRLTLHQLIREQAGPSARAPITIDSNVTNGPGLAKKTRAVGTITYDNGIPVAFTPTNSLMGNKFNQAISAGGSIVGVEPNGTITAFSAYMVFNPPPGGPGTTVSSAVSWAIFGPESAGGDAQRLANGLFLGGSGMVLHTLPTPVSYTGSSFHVDIMAMEGVSWQPTPAAPTFMFSMLAPAWSPGTLSGLGTHGVIMAQTTTASVNSLPFNMLVRASGNVIVPVELMSFSVE